VEVVVVPGAHRASAYLLQEVVAHRRLMVEDWKKQRVRKWE